MSASATQGGHKSKLKWWEKATQ